MSYLTEVKQVELNKLEWSSTSFQVSEFLKKFSLPQIVKVIEGFYGDDEESSLGADQVLTLHVLKSSDKIVGRDYRGKEVNIPLNCPNKVEIRPSNLKDVYESVDELCSVFPRYVRISQGYYSASKDEEILNVGDKLRLKGIDKSKKGQERLFCVNQNGQTIELPRDCIAGFQPLADGKEYYLAEVASQFRLPVYVQFIDPPTVGKQSRSADEVVFNSTLGSIYLENTYTENVVLASTISGAGRRNVVAFPRDMDIRIAVCEGMLCNSTDYAQICRSLNNGMDLASLQMIDTYSAFKPRNSVKAYSYRELVTYASTTGIKESLRSQEELSVETEGEPEVYESRDLDQPTNENEAAHEGLEMSEMTEVKNGERNGGNDDAFRSTAPPKPSRNQGSPAVRRNGNSPIVQRKEEDLQPFKSDEPNSEEAATAVNNTASSQGDEVEPPNPEDSDENTTTRSEAKVFVTTVSIAQPSVKKAPDVSGCSVKQVADILRELGMAKYVVKFESEMIDGEMLTCLNDDILMADFGMNKLHCMKLRKYLEGWRPKV